MGIFQKIFGEKTKATRVPFISNFITKYANGFIGKADDSQFLIEYKNWVYACIAARSEEVGNIQLKLMRGTEQVFEHPVLDLINQVNPQMTKHDLISSTQAFKDLTGNAYWFLARDGKDGQGEIKEIYLLRPDKMRIVLDASNPLIVAKYLYRQDANTEISFTAAEILHFKNFNPLGNYPLPHKGMGVVEAAMMSINTDNEARKWNYNFLKKSARPDGILYSDAEGVMDANEQKRTQEDWNETHQGADNSHKIAILQGGLKWQQTQLSAKDMDFVNQRTFSRDEILALFRTPKSIIGITDDVNRANADAAIFVFMRNCIKPLMQQMVDSMNEFLLPAFDGSLKFEFASPVPEDRAQSIAEYTAGIDKWLSRNEIRAKEGLPATENGDIFQGSFSNVEVDKVKPETIKNAKPQRKDEKADKDKSAAEKVVDKFTASLPKSVKIKTLSPDIKSKYIDLWNKNIDINTKPLSKKLRKYFEDQKTEVMGNLKDEFKGLEAKEFKLKGLGDVLFDEEDAISTGISMITPFIQNYIKQSGKDGAELVAGTFDATTAKVEKFIKDRAKYFAETINQTTADSLMSTLKEGVDAGEGISDLSQRVADVYQEADSYRTERIARTEVSASANFGSSEAYLQNGVEQHQWVTVSPEDNDCIENDGEVVKIGEAFSSGEDNPPVHPNCVCTTIPVF